MTIRRTISLVLLSLVDAFGGARLFAMRRRLLAAAGVSVSSDTRVMPGSQFHFSNVQLGHETWIGANAHFFSTRTASISIGNCCDVGPDCAFVVGGHAIGSRERRAGAGESRPIVVGAGTWVGARVTMLGGATVGRGCVIAAGSVVTRACYESRLSQWSMLAMWTVAA